MAASSLPGPADLYAKRSECRLSALHVEMCTVQHLLLSALGVGWDAKEISRIAKVHFEGSYKAMFAHHGWTLEKGQQYMHQAAPRIVQTYGSVSTFVDHFDAKRAQ